MGDYDGWSKEYRLKKKKHDKEKAMLGVWADDSDEESYSFSKLKKPLSLESIEFVSGGIVDFGNPEDGLKMSEAEKSTFREKVHQVAATQPMAQWERYTKGFGSKMLKKYGWKGGGLGLGRGLVNPIQVKVRSSRVGLSNTDCVKVERVARDEAEEKFSGDGVEAVESYTSSWRRYEGESGIEGGGDYYVKKKRQRTIYEVQDFGGESVAVVEDMGYESNMSGILPGRGGFLPELSYNIRSLIGQCSDNQLSCSNQSYVAESNLESFTREHGRLEILAKGVREKFENLRTLKELVVLMDLKLSSSELGSEDALEILRQFWKVVMNKYGEEYIKYKMEFLVIHFLFPILTRLVELWSPLEDPGGIFQEFEGWVRMFLDGEELEDESEDFWGLKRRIDGSNVSSRMVYEIVLPKIKDSLRVDWEVRMPWTAISLIQRWERLMKRSWRDAILGQIVLPKLRASIKDWRESTNGIAKTDANPDINGSLFEIVSPWWTYLGSELNEDLRREIQQISLELDSRAFYSILEPWRGILDGSQWTQLTVRTVLPRIEFYFRRVEIDPGDQDLHFWRQAYDLKPLISIDAFALSLETSGFWKNWFDVLGRWMHQDDADFEEIHDWFKFWKEESLFTKEVLEHYSVKIQFKHAMRLIFDMISGKTPGLDQFKPFDKDKSVEMAHRESHAFNWQDVSTKELVSRAVEDSGLLLLPTNRKHEGNTIHSVGKILVYFATDLVFANFGNGKWIPSSIEDVIKRAKID